MNDTEYRDCVSEEGNCKYMKLNEYGTPTCSIDGIVQVKWFGCRPAEILNKSGDSDVL